MGSTSDHRDPKPEVVTGYPAAATAAPRAGTAYPYPPPPPHAGPYYPNPNPNPNPNGYYPNPNPNYNGYYSNPNNDYRRNLFLRRLIAVVVGVFLIIGAITFIVWLVLRPKLPDFYVSGFDVSSFNLSSSNSLSAEFNISFTVQNPNSKMSVGYEEVNSAVFYGSDLIAETSMYPLYQKTGDVTNLKAKLVAAGVYVDDDVVSGIRSDRVDGVVMFGARVLSIVKFKAGVWRTRRHLLRVFCDDIGVGFKSATAGPRPKIVTVAYGRSSFIGRALVAALLDSSSPGYLTIRIADPLPPPSPPAHPQSGQIVHFQTLFDDNSGLRIAIEGSSTVFLVDPTLGVPPPPATSADFYNNHKAIVAGARNVVRVCRECGVERLIYTGTADVVFDGVRDVVGADESLPYPDKFMDVLNDLRAQAEMLVLNANGRDGLSTCVLRASSPFGPGDDYFVPLLVAKAKSTWAKFIIGSGKNLCDFTYVENIAHANICADQVLCSKAASVPGKSFFITNLETMKFWDFNSKILDGLRCQRPKVYLHIKFVLLLVALVGWVREKLHLCREHNQFLTPGMVHVLSCTRTYDSSKAQRLIQYSPVASLEDGIKTTVESISHLANGLPCLNQRDFSKPSKAESLLGSGKAADILLWRDEKKTFTCLLGLFLLLHWFLLSGRSFVSSTAKLLVLVSVILFVQGILPSSMLGFTIEKIPQSYLEVSELAIRNSLTGLASIWNNGLFILKSVSQEGDWNIFMKVAGSLCLVKMLLPFSVAVLTAIGVICLFSIFIIYEQCEEEIDRLMAIMATGFKKSKQSLSAKLSSFLTTYVHKS